MDDMKLNRERILSALKRTGERLAETNPELDCVEILLIGGAAGILTGTLRPERTTQDCDVIEFVPKGVAVAVETAASDIAGALSLDANWLNGHADWFIDILPDGWQQRRHKIGRFGTLRVFAASRLDLIALKVYAHRDQDVEDLDDLKVMPHEAERVRKHLLECLNRGYTKQQIEPAIEFLDAYMA